MGFALCCRRWLVRHAVTCHRVCFDRSFDFWRLGQRSLARLLMWNLVLIQATLYVRAFSGGSDLARSMGGARLGDTMSFVMSLRLGRFPGHMWVKRCFLRGCFPTFDVGKTRKRSLAAVSGGSGPPRTPILIMFDFVGLW